MTTTRQGFRSLALVVMLTTFAFSSSFAATAYTFEMIVFERPGADDGEFWPEAPGSPENNVTRSISSVALGSSARKLGPIAYTLRQRGMIVHEHIVWRETPGPRNSKRWWTVSAGRLSGQIQITRGRFLHLDTDLMLRESGSNRSYRVRLNRRMRSDELHYVDHPKLGIIIKATRVAAPTPEAIDPAAGEPKPAEPAGQPS